MNATCCTPRCGEAALPDADRCKRHEYKRLAEQRRKARARGDEHALGLVGTHCQRRYCRGVCGGQLVPFIDHRTGRVHMECPLCDRQAEGLCRDCPRRLRAKQALRCPDCAKRHQHRIQRGWYYRNTDRARKNGKAWRKRVLRDPVRGPQLVARERAYQEEYRSGTWWPAYMRAWRARRRTELAQQGGQAA